MTTLKCGIHFNPKANVMMKFLNLSSNDEILESILGNDLYILKDGPATWTSQVACNDSTRDISLCGCNWSAKTSSILEAPIGSSDHLPILVEINHKIYY